MPIAPGRKLPTLLPYKIQPGAPARDASAVPGSFAGTGAGEIPYYNVKTRTYMIFPIKSFPWTVPGHGTMAFFNNQPREISSQMYASMTAVNGTPAYATGTITLSGTPTVGDHVFVSVGGNSLTYIAVTGDTVLATLATHLAAAITANVSMPVSATAAAGVVTLQGDTRGTRYNTTLVVTKTGTVVVATSGPSLTGGVDGKLFVY